MKYLERLEESGAAFVLSEDRLKFTIKNPDKLTNIALEEIKKNKGKILEELKTRHGQEHICDRLEQLRGETVKMKSGYCLVCGNPVELTICENPEYSLYECSSCGFCQVMNNTYFKREA